MQKIVRGFKLTKRSILPVNDMPLLLSARFDVVLLINFGNTSVGRAACCGLQVHWSYKVPEESCLYSLQTSAQDTRWSYRVSESMEDVLFAQEVCFKNT